MKILINASNLHVGGGIQVAVSFINELSEILTENKYDIDISLYISTSVKKNLNNNINLDVFSTFKEINVFGVKSEKNNFSLNNFDVIFTVFGPLYKKTSNACVITGFAQPWIAYPNNLLYRKLSFYNKIKTKIIFFIKNRFFKRSNILIVEAEHIKSALIAQGYDKNKIITISNTISSIYSQENLWQDIKFSKGSNYTLGFIGRNYPHKNLSRLVEVNQILLEKYNLQCDFLFTLESNEMESNNFHTYENFKTVGTISVEQCPSFYKNIDALIFPSLLECFSAAPIEAMKMQKLVLASNLPFITDICKDSARYFDPLDNYSIARIIFEAATNHHENELLIKKSNEIVKLLPTPRDRAMSYLNIILNKI